MTVTLLRHMGSDLDVANTARVSFDKQSDYEIVDGVPTLRARDRKLIHFLARNKHWSPFSSVTLSFRVRAPLFVARQLWKSHIGLASQDDQIGWNEVSRRYVDTPPDFARPTAWRKRADDKKQGSSEEIFVGEEANQFDWDYEHLLDHVSQVYDDMLKSGVCPEQARMILPQSMLTEWIWTGSLYAFSRICQQRIAADAQTESRVVAEEIARHLRIAFPVSAAALLGE